MPGHVITSTGFLELDALPDRILGAHLIGPHCDEVINLFALAIRKGLTAEDLKTMMFAYPTASSDIVYMLRGLRPQLRCRLSGT